LHNNVCIVVPEWNLVITRTNGGRADGTANRPPNVDEIWSGFFARLAQGFVAHGVDDHERGPRPQEGRRRGIRSGLSSP